MLRRKYRKKERISSANRARIVRALVDRNAVCPPSVWLGVLRAARDSPDSDGAREGVWLFNAPCHVNAPGLALVRTLRKTGVSDEAASVLESARDVLRPPQLRDIEAMFNRPCIARALSRGVVSKGSHFCSALFDVVPGSKNGLRTWLGDTAVCQRAFSAFARRRVTSRRMHRM